MDRWIIDEEFAAEAKAQIRDPRAEKKWPSFEADVAANPFYHPVYRRIKKLRPGSGFPSKAYRYKKERLRVVYYPNKEDRTVYPLAAGTASTIAYKRRSRK